MLRAPRFLSLLAGLLLPAALAAQNLHPNGDFNDADGIAGWSAVNGTIQLSFADANDCPLSGSLRSTCSAPSPTATFFVLGPCVPTQQADVLEIHLELTSGGDHPLSFTVQVSSFSTPDCSGEDFDTAGFSFGESPIWFDWDDFLSVPAAGSLRFFLDGSSVGACVLYIDRLSVTRDPAPFLDDLEGGDECRWSASVG